LDEPVAEFLSRFEGGDYVALSTSFTGLKVKHLLGYTKEDLIAEAKDRSALARALYNALHPSQGVTPTGLDPNTILAQLEALALSQKQLASSQEQRFRRWRRVRSSWAGTCIW
jgi:hypothetical protein